MGLSPVVSIRLKFVCADRDRHDNVRYYVRLPGRRKVRLKGPPGSHEFMAEYHAALAGNDVNGPAAARVVVGSFGATCLAYYASYQFKALDRSTQAWRRRLLDEICREHGHKPVVRMEPRHVRQLVYALGERPAVANKLLKALRAVFSWAVDTELCSCRSRGRQLVLIQHAQPVEPLQLALKLKREALCRLSREYLGWRDLEPGAPVQGSPAPTHVGGDATDMTPERNGTYPTRPPL